MRSSNEPADCTGLVFKWNFFALLARICDHLATFVGEVCRSFVGDGSSGLVDACCALRVGVNGTRREVSRSFSDGDAAGDLDNLDGDENGADVDLLAEDAVEEDFPLIEFDEDLSGEGADARDMGDLGDLGEVLRAVSDSGSGSDLPGSGPKPSERSTRAASPMPPICLACPASSTNRASRSRRPGIDAPNRATDMPAGTPSPYSDAPPTCNTR